MSDYDRTVRTRPAPGPAPDRPHEPANVNSRPSWSSRNFYLVLGAVMAVLVVAALMFFTSRPLQRIDTAREPDRTFEAPTNETRTPPIPPRPQQQ